MIAKSYDERVYKSAKVFTVCVIIAVIFVSAAFAGAGGPAAELEKTAGQKNDVNVITGNFNNAITADNKTINGNNNTITGNNNIINGNFNTVNGDNNFINGNNNTINGEDNEISGNFNNFKPDSGNILIKGNNNRELE